MPSGNLKLYLFLAILTFLIVIPIVKSALQEASLGQDIRGIQMDYSTLGRTAFRAKLDEIILRAPLDPKEVEVRMQENPSHGNVQIEILYVSRMKILFYPYERQVIVRKEIPLVPL